MSEVGMGRALWRLISFYWLRKSLGLIRAADRQFTGSVGGVRDAFDIHREKLVRQFNELRDAVAEVEGILEAKRQEFQERYERQAQIQKEQDGGPQWPIVVLSRIGPSLSRLILQSYYRQRITLNDVSGYLGLKVPHIPKLEAAAYGRSL